MKQIISVILILSLIACAELSDGENSDQKLSRQKRKVLTFPPNTVLQLTMCIISQISFIPSHKVAINLGFNFNYALPYTLSSVYNPAFWARKLSMESNPIMTFMDKFIESESARGTNVNVTEKTDTTTELPTMSDDAETEEYDDASTDSSVGEDRAMRKKRSEHEVRVDTTAAEFYNGLKQTFEFSGYHESCLLKSVCELAKHPIHRDNDQEGDNLIKELIHLVLTPSVHQSFDPVNEINEQREFEEAEEFGRSDGDCNLKYGSMCSRSPLESISRYVNDNTV